MFRSVTNLGSFLMSLREIFFHFALASQNSDLMVAFVPRILAFGLESVQNIVVFSRNNTNAGHILLKTCKNNTRLCHPGFKAKAYLKKTLQVTILLRGNIIAFPHDTTLIKETC